jgi:CHRD domain
LPFGASQQQEDFMTARTNVSIAIAALAALATVSAFADGNHRGNGNGGNDEDNGTTFATKLVGYEETPLTLNSPGSGSFKATVNSAGTAINYTLSYTPLSSAITQSHIHFGRPALTGQIVLFLCTNVGLPAGVTVPMPQACPPGPATITGTLTAADVIARPTQGIDAGAAGFAEMIKAMRASAAYANVHTTTFPSGEIRGAIGPRDDDDDND